MQAVVVGMGIARSAVAVAVTTRDIAAGAAVHVADNAATAAARVSTVGTGGVHRSTSHRQQTRGEKGFRAC